MTYAEFPEYTIINGQHVRFPPEEMKKIEDAMKEAAYKIDPEKYKEFYKNSIRFDISESMFQEHKKNEGVTKITKT